MKIAKIRPAVVRIDADGYQERLRARRDALVSTHLDLVRSLALSVQKSLPPSFDLEDLIGVGHLALIQVATRYRPDDHNGTPFSAYARVRIRGAMLDSVKRRHYAENTRPSIDEVGCVAEPCNIEQKIDEERDVQRIREALQVLRPSQRQAVERKFWDGKRNGGDDLESALIDLRRRLKVA